MLFGFEHSGLLDLILLVIVVRVVLRICGFLLGLLELGLIVLLILALLGYYSQNTNYHPNIHRVSIMLRATHLQM